MRTSKLIAILILYLSFATNATRAQEQIKDLRVRGGDFFGAGLCDFTASKSLVNKYLKAGWRLVSLTPVSFTVQKYDNTINCYGTSYILRK